MVVVIEGLPVLPHATSFAPLVREPRLRWERRIEFFLLCSPRQVFEGAQGRTCVYFFYLTKVARALGKNS